MLVPLNLTVLLLGTICSDLEYEVCIRMSCFKYVTKRTYMNDFSLLIQETSGGMGGRTWLHRIS